MTEKIQIRCHYCGISKDEYGKVNQNTNGINLLFRGGESDIEYNVWFCGKIHRDFFLDENREKITIIGNT